MPNIVTPPLNSIVMLAIKNVFIAACLPRNGLGQYAMNYTTGVQTSRADSPELAAIRMKHLSLPTGFVRANVLDIAPLEAA